jgi:predicted nucleotidyltransferase
MIPENHRAVVERFIELCQTDERITVAMLVGSYAKGTADAYSDLDVCVLAADEAFEELTGEKEDFVRRLGEPVFMTDWGQTDLVSYVLANGTVGEVIFGRESDAHAIQGPYVLLVDKKNRRGSLQISAEAVDTAAQTEVLRGLIDGFWHDADHFISAVGRGEWWWAQGQVEALRSICVSLERLEHDFGDGTAASEPYFKLDKAMPVDKLEVLRETFCRQEEADLLRAGVTVIGFYRQIARRLAQAHGLRYPEGHERVVLGHLETLRGKLKG